MVESCLQAEVEYLEPRVVEFDVLFIVVPCLDHMDELVDHQCMREVPLMCLFY